LGPVRSRVGRIIDLVVARWRRRETDQVLLVSAGGQDRLSVRPLP